MAVTRQSWANSVLSALGLPTSKSNVQIMVGWTLAEGGAGPQFGVAGNTASFNPLNTKQVMPGSTDSGGGIQAYQSWAQGLEATIQTLSNGNFGSILSMLQSGEATPAAAAAAIDGSRWGTQDLTAALISGATTTGGDPVQGVTGGGIFGLGGTGTSSGGPNGSLWQVGDSLNPDQDYWTTINQYGQDAQWYVFSDGDALYAADGFKLMGQTPAALIALFDPNVLAADLTYDNTAFQATHTSLKKGKVVRRAALARTTSPTECEIKVICDIDKFRGGEVVYLKQFGPADGLWLVGECRRSMFQIYSTLTLTQAMMPVNALTGLELGPQYLAGSAASAAGSGTVIATMISEAASISNEHLPYVWGGGHKSVGKPDGGQSGSPVPGFDCSGAVAAVLAAGGLWPDNTSVPSDAGVISQLLNQGGVIAPGQGTGRPEVTLFDNPGHHIYMRINGQYWGTWAGGADAPGGGGWCPSGFPMPGFNAYHVLPSVLGQQPAQISQQGG